MSNIQEQVHNHFKVFAGTYNSHSGLGPLAEAVPAWAKSSGAAPKSIGIEYLEHAKRLMLTVGYRTDEPGYAIRLQTVNLGKIENLDETSLASLETRMGNAASGVANIICHELFVTETADVLMVFMTHA